MKKFIVLYSFRRVKFNVQEFIKFVGQSPNGLLEIIILIFKWLEDASRRLLLKDFCYRRDSLIDNNKTISIQPRTSKI